MGISTKSTYGLRAMYELALSYNKGPVSVSEISEREAISVPYLEQLLNRLRRAGLVKSMRGSRGGYALSRPPEEISVGDIVRTLDGAVMPVHCLSNGRKKRDCVILDHCVTKYLWARLKLDVDKMLDDVTLKDVCAEGAKIHSRVKPESGHAAARQEAMVESHISRP